MKGLLPVSEIIPKVIKPMGLQKKSEQVEIMLEWGSIVGEKISAKTKPDGVKRGVLRVLVESSSWMNELQLIKPELMTKIENRFGKNKIRDIRFCLGKIERDKNLTKKIIDV
jgi:predicted nucleic acid-binding Zn ribbon protein